MFYTLSIFVHNRKNSLAFVLMRLQSSWLVGKVFLRVKDDYDCTADE